MPSFLFRGTTEGFEGSESSINEPSTNTSTNPFLSYQFAKECRKYGSAVVSVYKYEDVEELRGPGNCFESDELEVCLSVTPMDAFNLALFTVSEQKFIRVCRQLRLRIEDYAVKTDTNRYISIEQPSEEIIELLVEELQND